MRWLRSGGAALALVVAALVGYEGFSSTPYQDQASVWTNGYGETQGITAKTAPISEPAAKAVLTKRVLSFQEKIDACLTRPAGPNTSAAFTTFAYNIGSTAFCNSTAARAFNAGNLQKACDSMLLWNKIRVHGKLVPNRGLDNRRRAERAMCLKDL